jgi:ankyrin repeat protein
MKFLALVSLVATLGTQSFAQTCGNLCSPEFWNTATTQEIATAIDSVDVNARTEDGVTPLSLAAAFGNPETIAALVEAGADVNARLEDGWTPLHIAAALGTPENIAALLEAGADGTAEDDQGETPWDWAQDNASIRGTTAYWALNEARFR